MAGERDGLPGDLRRVAVTIPVPDLDAGPLEALEERGVVAGTLRG